MRPIVLSGFMATGKSTVGPRSPRASACRSSTPTRRSSAPRARRVPELWREEGEAAFRAREAALVDELLRTATPRVIAFGGGTVTVERTRRLALDRALVVTLTASPETIVARVPDLGGAPEPRRRRRPGRARCASSWRRAPRPTPSATCRCRARRSTPKRSSDAIVALASARSRSSCRSARGATPSTSATASRRA